MSSDWAWIVLGLNGSTNWFDTRSRAGSTQPRKWCGGATGTEIAHALLERINALTGEHRQHAEEHQHARAAARAAIRTANELAARAEHIAIEDEHRRLADQAQATDNDNAGRDAAVEALQQTVRSELADHRAEHQRRQSLAPSQRHREERERLEFTPTVENSAAENLFELDANQPIRRTEMGL